MSELFLFSNSPSNPSQQASSTTNSHSSSIMTTNRQIPTELLKFRLDKEFLKLRSLLTKSKSKSESLKTSSSSSAYSVINESKIGEVEEDNFQLYQRILSWFIMGRLSKTEYDKMIEKLLNNAELIELHNRVLELLRAIYCGYDQQTTSSSSETGGNDNVENDINNHHHHHHLFLSYNEFVPELYLSLDNSILDSSQNKNHVKSSSSTTTATFRPSSLLKLSQSEETFITETVKIPLHLISNDKGDAFISGVDLHRGSNSSNDMAINRIYPSCQEIACLPDQNLMKNIILSIGSELIEDAAQGFDGENNNFNFVVDDQIPILACKSLEDYLKNILENVLTLKTGNIPKLRPPISYIFNEYNNEDVDVEEVKSEAIEDVTNSHTSSDDSVPEIITENDLLTLFNLKPWLLADMKHDLQHLFFDK